MANLAIIFKLLLYAEAYKLSALIPELIFPGPDHFTFAVGTRQLLDMKARLQHVPPYLAFCRIGGQDRSPVHTPVDPGENTCRPQVRLPVRGKGIEIYKVVKVPGIEIPEIALHFI